MRSNNSVADKARFQVVSSREKTSTAIKGSFTPEWTSQRIAVSVNTLRSFNVFQ